MEVGDKDMMMAASSIDALPKVEVWVHLLLFEVLLIVVDK